MINRPLPRAGDLVEITFTRTGTVRGIVLQHLTCTDWMGKTTAWVKYLFLEGEEIRTINLPSGVNCVAVIEAGYAFALPEFLIAA